MNSWLQFDSALLHLQHGHPRLVLVWKLPLDEPSYAVLLTGPVQLPAIAASALKCTGHCLNMQVPHRTRRRRLIWTRIRRSELRWKLRWQLRGRPPLGQMSPPPYATSYATPVSPSTRHAFLPLLCCRSNGLQHAAQDQKVEDFVSTLCVDNVEALHLLPTLRKVWLALRSVASVPGVVGLMLSSDKSEIWALADLQVLMPANLLVELRQHLPLLT